MSAANDRWIMVLVHAGRFTGKLAGTSVGCFNKKGPMASNRWTVGIAMNK